MQDVKSPMGQKISGNWKQFIGKVKETWGSLTDDELDQFEGEQEQLEGHIEERTGESRQNIRTKIDKISSALKKRV